MVSKYDIFYVIAGKGELGVTDIVEALNKPKKEYQNIFNNVLELEREGLVKRDTAVKVIQMKNLRNCLD